MTSKAEKARRMELRKKIGNRVIDPPQPLPNFRGPEYLIAHACFECRVSFKRPPIDGNHKCPNCGEVAHEMGRYFKVPKKSNIDQWRKVRRLWEAGYRFYGSSDDTPYPVRFAEVEDFIKSNPRHYNRLRSYWPKD